MGFFPFPPVFYYDALLPWWAGPPIWIAGLLLLEFSQQTSRYFPRMGWKYYLISAFIRPGAIFLISFGWFEVLGQRHLSFSGPVLDYTALIMTYGLGLGAAIGWRRPLLVLLLLVPSAFHYFYLSQLAWLSITPALLVVEGSAILSLGLRRSFLFRKDDDPIVMSGLYSFCRHPQLAVTIIMAFAAAFNYTDLNGIAPNSFALINAVAFTLGVVLLTRAEDRDLNTASPIHRLYAENVPALIPHIHKLARFSYCSSCQIIVPPSRSTCPVCDSVPKSFPFDLTFLTRLGIAICIVLMLPIIAHPGYLPFGPRSKRSEAKVNLGAVFTSEQAYHEKTGTYAASFEDVGWYPEGEHRYGYCIGSDYIPPSHKSIKSKDQVRINAWAAEYCPPASRPDASSFTALAVGNPDRDKALDVWAINHDKSLQYILNDLPK